MDLALQRLSNRLAYQFKNFQLLRQALTHRSTGAFNNERLEFLGDALLGAAMADRLFEQYPCASEGDLTRMRAVLVRKDTLAAVGKRLEIGPCLFLGGGELKSGGQRRSSIMADAVEALIGAVYLDAGMDICRQCIERWFAEELRQVEPTSENRDAKTRLQEYLQGRSLGLPAYELLATEGDPHNQRFVVRCNVVDLGLMVSGVGTSRRKAEQEAADKTLEQIRSGAGE